MGPFTFGKAIDMINANPNKLVMMRKGWHGTQQGRSMHVSLRSMLAFKPDDNDPKMGTPIKGDTLLAYIFTRDGVIYPWNPSPNDMMQDDWMLLEI